MISILIPIALFYIPLIVFYLLYGQTRSVSAIFYELPEGYRKPIWVGWQWSFSWAMFFAFPTPLIFGAAALISFSAAAGDTRSNEITEKVHGVGAIGGIAFAMGEVFKRLQWEGIAITILFVIFTLYSHYRPIRNHTYHIEWVAFTLLVIYKIFIYGS